MFRIKNLIVPSRNGPTLLLSRMWSESVGQPTYKEQELAATLRIKFAKAKDIQVHDISGGCGAMYEITVESNEFQGMSRVRQHQMIVDALKEEIRDMHGIRIHTIVEK